MECSIEIGQFPNKTELTTNQHVNLKCSIEHDSQGNPVRRLWLIVNTEDYEGTAPSVQFINGGWSEFERMGFSEDDYAKIYALPRGGVIDHHKDCNGDYEGVYIMRVA